MYHNCVVYHKIQMHSFLKVESLGETRCRKSWRQFKGYDSQSLRCVMRVSGKRKDHRLGKINVKAPHQRSPYAMKFEDRSHEETERQQRCVLVKAYTSSKKKTRLRCALPRRNGYSWLRQQKSGRKESLWLIRMHMVSQ